MQQYLIRGAILVATFALFGLSGCGESGSDPIQYPEVRFQVVPAGQATFTIDSLIGGGVSHASVTGKMYTATGPLNFVLENASPPYVGSATLVSGDQITVTLSVISTTGQTQVSDATAPGKPTAMVVAGGTAPTVPPPPSNPEVRFDVCAPPSGQFSCAIGTEPGAFGVPFTGTLGDPATSHVLSSVTPTIYFLEAPQDNVNAVFVRQVITGDFLVALLFFDGIFQQTQASPQDVVIKQDLP